MWQRCQRIPLQQQVAANLHVTNGVRQGRQIVPNEGESSSRRQLSKGCGGAVRKAGCELREGRDDRQEAAAASCRSRGLWAGDPNPEDSLTRLVISARAVIVARKSRQVMLAIRQGSTVSAKSGVEHQPVL